MKLPSSWNRVLASESAQLADIAAFVATERAKKTVFPPDDDVFNAFSLTSYDDVRVVLLGQDPYHDDGQAHGLCFSVKPPTKPPPSLKNIFKELESDLGIAPPDHGDLTSWAKQGVLLLNAVLTVVAHTPASHAGKGWEQFTDAVIRAVNEKSERVVFCLWGNYARKKAVLIERARHAVVEGAHPSPLSMKKFFGSKPFSSINTALVEGGQKPIDWRIP
jgi:uracil-DNA glycosylase